MFEKTINTVAPDGTKLFTRIFFPNSSNDHENVAEQKVQGWVLIIHGFAEHSGRYNHIAEELCRNKLGVIAYDQRGHGYSGPSKGFAPNLSTLVLDVLKMLQVADETFKTTKQSAFRGIIGHSFGGAIATRAAAYLGRNCPPLFLSSPCYKIAENIPFWKKFLGQSLGRLSPNLPIPLSINPKAISNNPQNNAAYMADELNLFHVSAQLGTILLEATEEGPTDVAAKQIAAPVKVVVGSEDILVDTARVSEVSSLIEKHSLKTVVGAGHEIFNEKNDLQEIAINELLNWVAQKGNLT